MTFSNQILLLFFFFFPLLNASEPKRCYSSSCGGRNIDVRFPFRLLHEQSSTCGYPGFDVHCTDRHENALILPNSGPFLLRSVNEGTQRIRLNDPDNCLAKRLLNFNSSQSPFSPLHLLNYTFFTCPNQDLKSSPFEPIHCLGNSTTSFFAVPPELTSSMPSSCQIFKTLLVPVSSPFAVDFNNQDLWLKWDLPDCTTCTDFHPLCGFVNNNTLQVKCFAYVASGSPWLYTIKILCLCLSVPFLYVVVPALCIIFLPKGKTEMLELAAERKSVVPSPNDTICSICLSESATKETVKCLPK